MRPVAITSFGSWTSGGVSLNAAPHPGSGPELGPWPQAPELPRIHPRARRPHPLAKAMVQLAHEVLAHRAPLSHDGMALLVGGEAGCAAADLDFFTGVKERGAAFGSPSVFVYTLTSAAPGEVSIAAAARGPLLTVSAGAASAATALAMAAAGVASGRYPSCLCGALEAATFGKRRAFGEGRGDELALFLLEPADAAHRAVRLDSWRAGFGRPPEGAAAFTGSAIAGELARLKGKRRIFAAAPEGFWAELELSSSP